MTRGLQGDFAQWGNSKKASVPIAQLQSVCFCRSVPENLTPLRSGRLLQSTADPSSKCQREAASLGGLHVCAVRAALSTNDCKDFTLLVGSTKFQSRMALASSK